MTENFDFKINGDTEVQYSCSSVLNGEVFVFGGNNSSNNRKKQVTLNLRLISASFAFFRFLKLLAVS